MHASHFWQPLLLLSVPKHQGESKRLTEVELVELGLQPGTLGSLVQHVPFLGQQVLLLEGLAFELVPQV